MCVYRRMNVCIVLCCVCGLIWVTMRNMKEGEGETWCRHLELRINIALPPPGREFTSSIVRLAELSPQALGDHF